MSEDIKPTEPVKSEAIVVSTNEDNAIVKPSKKGTKGEIKRDSTSGRWLKGTAAGPGNPYLDAQAKLRAAMYKAVKANDITEVLQASIQKAKEGDVKHARLILEFTLGRPKQEVEAIISGLSPEQVKMQVDALLGISITLTGDGN